MRCWGRVPDRAFLIEHSDHGSFGEGKQVLALLTHAADDVLAYSARHESAGRVRARGNE